MPQIETHPPISPITLVDGSCAAPPMVTETRDPFEKFDDLMTVIEAFSPPWPVRGTFRPADRFVL